MNIGMAYFEFGGTKGVARAAAELARCIAARGHDVDFHCIQHHSGDPRIHFTKVAALNSFTSFGIASFAVMGKRSVQRSRYDITHSHGNIIGADIITAHSCHRAGMRAHRAKSFGLADRIRLHLEKKNYAEKNFQKVIAVADGVKRELMDEYKLAADDVVVIPNGVNLEQFNPEMSGKKRGEIRRKLGLAEDACAILFVANEFERKGLGFVIAALSLLRDVNAQLLVLGEDGKTPYEAQAKNSGVHERVQFLGGVNNIEDYCATADVFVLPTYYEAFSLATLEAAASGLPLVVTKVNGTEEFVENGKNGFFIERDADDIAEKLRTLCEDKSLREQLGANARKSAGRYSWESIADRTIQVYEHVRK